MASIHKPEFQRAFAAVSYLAGRRGADLLGPLPAPGEEAQSLVRRLEHPERERRAEVLARELNRLALSLDARKLT
ncbi:MAG: hypothetical protein ABW061_05330 [Polyangiaceae bacterium]